MSRCLLSAVLAAACLALVPVGAHAKEAEPNHEGAAIGGAIAGMVCGGATLVYAKARERAGGAGPLLWHSGESPGWIGVFFLEHAGVGGLTGAFANGPRQGFWVGAAVTCTLDIAWIVTAEILAKWAREDDEALARLRAGPPLGLAEKGPHGWRVGLPPVVVSDRGAWMSLFAWRF